MGTVLGYLLVEGAHDIAVVEKILEVSHGFSLVRTRSGLDAHIPKSDWLRLIDHDKAGTVDAADLADDIVSRRHVPYFLADPHGRVIVIDPANGESGMKGRLHIVGLTTGLAGIAGWGIVLDADRASPTDKLGQLGRIITGLPTVPGASGILPGPPRVGVHILPDNQRPGTLEEPLINAAEISYPKTIAQAKRYIDAVTADPDAWPGKEWAGMKKPAGKGKATIAAVTAIIKPGKTTQASIADHAWVTPATIANTDLKHLDSFLTALFF